MNQQEISIEEMVMDGFRIMRNGNCKTAAQLRNAIRLAFPFAEPDRINVVMRKLADIARSME